MEEGKRGGRSPAILRAQTAAHPDGGGGEGGDEDEEDEDGAVLSSLGVLILWDACGEGVDVIWRRGRKTLETPQKNRRKGSGLKKLGHRQKGQTVAEPVAA
jgi:hypothetical protein